MTDPQPQGQVARGSGAVPIVLQQHFEDAALLHTTRTLLTRAPHVKLHHLRRFDDRLEAHLDGLAIAGDEVRPFADEALERPVPGHVFAIAVRAIESRDATALDRVLALCEAIPEISSGLISAFGWLEAPQLQGVVVELLHSSSLFRRRVGIAASALHRIDPGFASGCGIQDEDAAVRARAWRAVGELGLRELLPRALNALTDEDPTCRFWAAWSAVLLGGGEQGLSVLTEAAREAGPNRAHAFLLSMQTMSAASSHEWLKGLAADPANLRWLIKGAGLVGDPTYVPWLIKLMSDDAVTRLAGESFSLITGLDLAWLDLERKPPETLESGPTDDPSDPNVDMDEDDGLPWPDPKRIQEWWSTNAHRFQPGTRYFMGDPLNRDTCLRVLKDGFQRQRIAAALYLSLLNPGTPLFEWRAPSRRQQALLAQMS